MFRLLLSVQTCVVLANAPIVPMAIKRVTVLLATAQRNDAHRQKEEASFQGKTPLLVGSINGENAVVL